MNGSVPADAVLVASPASPEAWPARMAAASRVLLAVSARACAAEPAVDCGVTLPLSATVGSTGAATRGTVAVSDAGAAGGGATARTGCLPASAALGSQLLLRSTSAASCSGVRDLLLFISA